MILDPKKFFRRWAMAMAIAWCLNKVVYALMPGLFDSFWVRFLLSVVDYNIGLALAQIVCDWLDDDDNWPRRMLRKLRAGPRLAFA